MIFRSDIEIRRAEICGCIDRCDDGDGVIVLTDMFGATPSNLAMSAADRPNLEVVAGVNLPMLVKLAKCRSAQPLADAVATAEESGKRYIGAASHLLRGPCGPDGA